MQVFSRARFYKSRAEMVRDGWFTPVLGLITRESIERHISGMGFPSRNAWTTEIRENWSLCLHMQPRNCSRWRKRFRTLERSMRRNLPAQVQLIPIHHKKKETTP